MFQYDHDRPHRVGMPEAILCLGKSDDQLVHIIEELRGPPFSPVLFTRLAQDHYHRLPESSRTGLEYDAPSATAVLHGCLPARPGSVAVVAAGTSDVPVAAEAERTLRFSGITVRSIVDVGVAGVWRLEERLDDIRAADVVIVVAGMDAALVSVLGGLLTAPVVAVPTSTGYGATRHGDTALRSALVSCAQGIAVVNIDNGFGAACAAIRILSLK